MIFLFTLERLSNLDTNVITDSFYGKQLRLLTLLPLSTVKSAGTRLPLSSPCCHLTALSSQLLPCTAALLHLAQSWYCTASMSVTNTSDRSNVLLFQLHNCALWVGWPLYSFLLCGRRRFLLYASASWSLWRRFSCCFLLVFSFDFFPLFALAD